jgi:hypothetical protein
MDRLGMAELGLGLWIAAGYMLLGLQVASEL